MKKFKRSWFFIATAGLFLAGCETDTDRVYDLTLCVLAAETLNGTPPGDAGIKAGEVIDHYTRKNKISISHEQTYTLAGKAYLEITGDPELPIAAQIDRAKHLTESETCKNFSL